MPVTFTVNVLIAAGLPKVGVVVEIKTATGWVKTAATYDKMSGAWTAVVDAKKGSIFIIKVNAPNGCSWTGSAKDGTAELWETPDKVRVVAGNASALPGVL